MRKIVVANQKGGVGKTTSAINLADGLQHCGYKVLFLDLDPQCNSTSTYQATITGENTIYDVMEDKCLLTDAIQKTEVGDIVAGDPLLTEIESKIQQKIGGYNIIKKALKTIENDYDFCIMDTPPNLGIFMINCLTAADSVLIPIKAEKYAIDGLTKLLHTISEVVENSNDKLKISGVLLNVYDVRNSLDRNVWNILPSIGEKNNFKVFKTPIRICQPVKDAQADGVSLFSKYPNCNAAVDYANIIKELLEV